MLEKLKNIFYRPDFFRRQEFTAGQTLSFYSLSVLFLVLGLSLILIPAAWGINRFFESAQWQEQKQIIETLYPDGLVLTLEHGKLTTNQAAPVVIPFPKEWVKDGQCRKKKHCEQRELPVNLLVIDKSAELSRKAIESRDTLVLASETEIGMSNPRRGETRIFSTAEFNFDQKIVVNKDSFVYWINRGASIVQTAILFLLAVLPLIMFVVLWVGYIMYSLLGALVVWLAAHIRNHRLTYGRAYLSTLYLLPASFLMMVVMSAMSYRIPLLFTIILFGMALLNFDRRAKEKVLPGPFTDTHAAVIQEAPTTPARPTSENKEIS